MYGKIFASMFEGSLYGQWEAIITFTVMIVLADRDGVVDMTAQALSARTSIPLDIIQRGIAQLEAPDPQSRTPDEDGRRILRVSPDRDWGWKITNHAYYRALRTAEERRAYHRQYYRDNRSAEARAAKDESREESATSSTNTQHIQTNSTNSRGRGRGRGRSKDPVQGVDGGGGKRAAATDAERGAWKTMMAVVPDEARDDFAALYRSCTNPDSLRLELDTLLKGKHPRAEGATVEDVCRGVREYLLQADGRLNRLANFVRIARKNRLEGVRDAPTRPRPATGDDIERLRQEMNEVSQ